jgi:hypothetical protein
MGGVYCKNEILTGEPEKQRFVVQYKHPESLRLEYLELEAETALAAVDECARIVRSRCALPHAQVSVVEIKSLRMLEPYHHPSDQTVEEHMQGMASSLAGMTGGAVVIAIRLRDPGKTYTGCAGHLDSKEALQVALDAVHHVKFRS